MPNITIKKSNNNYTVSSTISKVVNTDVGFAVDRANHTGTQAITTVTGLNTALNAKLSTANNLSELAPTASEVRTNLNLYSKNEVNTSLNGKLDKEYLNVGLTNTYQSLEGDIFVYTNGLLSAFYDRYLATVQGRLTLAFDTATKDTTSEIIADMRKNGGLPVLWFSSSAVDNVQTLSTMPDFGTVNSTLTLNNTTSNVFRTLKDTNFGTDDFVTTNRASTGDLTYIALIRQDSTTGSKTIIGSTTGNGMPTMRLTNGIVQSQLAGVGGTVTGTTAVAAGKYSVAAMTRADSNGQTKLFRALPSIKKEADSNIATADTIRNIAIGVDQGTVNYFNGSVVEALVYDKVLTETEVENVSFSLFKRVLKPIKTQGIRNDITPLLIITYSQSNAISDQAYIADLDPSLQDAYFENAIVYNGDTAKLENLYTGPNFNNISKNGPTFTHNKFGPEVRLMQDLLNVFRTVGLIKYVYGGTGIVPDGRATGDWAPSSNELYNTARDTYITPGLAAFRAKYTNVVPIYIRLQGETERTDSVSAADYQAALQTLYNTNNTDHAMTNPYWIECGIFGTSQINTGKQAFVAANPDSYFVNLEALPIVLADGVHYNSNSVYNVVSPAISSQILNILN